MSILNVFGDLVIYDLVIGESPNHQITKSLNRNEGGAALVTVALALGTLLGGVAVSLVAMNLSAARQAAGVETEVRLTADHLGRIFMGTALLAQRLQDPSLLGAQDLQALASSLVLPHSSLVIEDEGGKVSLPVNAYVLPEVLRVYGVDQFRDKALEIAGYWGATIVDAPWGKYPVMWPTTNVQAFPRFESAEDLGEALGLPWSQIREANKWFTPCEIVGVNVNTADERCLAGLLDWQRKGSMTWVDRLTQGNLSGATFYLYPVPGPEPVVPKLTRPSALDVHLPVNTIYPTDPTESVNGYNAMWQLAQMAMNSPFFVEWLKPPKYNYAKFSGAEFYYQTDYSHDAYAVRQNAWFRFTSAGSASDVMAGRPYQVAEVTQPLGLLWITPESWCLPMSPAFMGDLHDSAGGGSVPPFVLNTALSAAAFTGWISLQGPGSYTTASEWYTFVASSSQGGVHLSRRLTIQVWPDEMPRILMASYELE